MELPLVFARRISFFFVFILHSILFFFNIWSLCEKSGTVFEAVSATLSSLVFMALLTSFVYKYFHPLADPTNTRSLITIGVIWLISIINSILLSVRSGMTNGLFADFAQVPSGYSVAIALLVLTWLSCVAALIGLVICHHDELPGVRKVVANLHPTIDAHHHRWGIASLPGDVTPPFIKEHRLRMAEEANSSYTMFPTKHRALSPQPVIWVNVPV